MYFLYVWNNQNYLSGIRLWLFLELNPKPMFNASNDVEFRSESSFDRQAQGADLMVFCWNLKDIA